MTFPEYDMAVFDTEIRIDDTLRRLPARLGVNGALTIDQNTQSAAAKHAIYIDAESGGRRIANPFYIIGRSNNGDRALPQLLLSHAYDLDRLQNSWPDYYVLSLPSNFRERFRQRTAISQLQALAVARAVDEPLHLKLPAKREMQLTEEMIEKFAVSETIDVIRSDFGLL